MSEKKVYAMVPEGDVNEGLVPGLVVQVTADKGAHFFFRYPDSPIGTEHQDYWADGFHVGGNPWDRLELTEEEAAEINARVSDPLDSHPNSETDADQYSVGADTVDDCEDRLPLQYEPEEERTSEGAVSMADQYPAYYKDVSGVSAVDVYSVHQLFGVDDPSGCIHHASKKLLLSGVRTGGKSKRDDIREARDTLTRWLDLNHE